MFYQRHISLLTHTFRSLQAGSMLEEEPYSGEYSRIIDALYLSMINWLPFCEVKQEAELEAGFQQHMWSIIFPLLTPKGREAMKEIVSYRIAI